jgi:acetolactate synthase-1/2/3 large subunit
MLAGSQKAAAAAGRRHLERTSLRRRAALRRSERPAGGLRLPLPGPARQRHPHYVGDVGIGINPKLAARVKEADVLIAFGPRLGEMTTSGYSLLPSPVPQQRLVHIHPDPQELGSVYQAELMIAGGAPQAAAMLAAMEPVDSSPGATRSRKRAELRAWQEQPPIFKDGSAPLDLWQLVQDMQAALPHDTIITNGAGNYATWAHRFWRYGAMRTQLAPTSGAMGYACRPASRPRSSIRSAPWSPLPATANS